MGIMKKACRRVLPLVLSLALLFSVTVTSARAAGWLEYPFEALGQAVNTRILGAAQKAAENLAAHAGGYLLTSLLTGMDTMIGGTVECRVGNDCQEAYAGSKPYCVQGVCSDTPNAQPHIGADYNPYLYGGAIGAIGDTIAVTYTIPPSEFIRTGDFFRRTLANNILNRQPAYADVIGWQKGTADLATSGIGALWYLFRNLAYVFMVIILLAFGLMVLLGYKADPRTVVTAQMAIPRITIALVLITFSYPLAGFMMDIGNVASHLVWNTFTTLAVTPRWAIDACENPFTHPTTSSAFPISMGFGCVFRHFILSRLMINIGIGPVFGVVEGLIGFILRIFVLWISLKLLWVLISRYASIFIYTIIAPFAFLWGALPGQEDTTSKWFRSMIVNVLVFPAVLIVVNIAEYVRLIAYSGSISFPLPPGFYNRGDIGGLVAIGILAMAPKVAAILEDALAVTTAPGVAKAGIEPRSVLKAIPIIGGLV